METLKFMRCRRCGNIVVFLQDSGMPMICCGQKMEEILPNKTDGAYEKHLPVVQWRDDCIEVVVGSVEHPMSMEHFIEWIILEYEGGFEQIRLKPGDRPCAFFEIKRNESPVAAYAYCNLHGLWKTVI